MKQKNTAPACETCEFYDWDSDYETYVCTQRMDQDDAYAYHISRSNRSGCPYYRYYDEYKTVRKQN